MSSPNSGYGQATTPQAPMFQTNPNGFASYDRTNLANRAASQVGQDTANATNQAVQRAVQLGGGRTGGVERAATDTQALGEQRLADVRNQQGLAGFQEKLGQLAQQNQFNQGNYQSQIEEQKAQQAAYQKQFENSQQLLGSIFGPVLGSALGL